MSVPEPNVPRNVPPRALALSLLALLVPVGSDLLLPEGILGAHQPLLWLVALIPAFLLAYYKGWTGAATALAAGMATLAFTQAIANVLGREIPDLLLGVVVFYVGLSLGIGWLAERLHRERAAVEDLAFTDLLTHLPNRRHARVFLDNEFAAAERGRPLSVVLFDLDNFKLYNDRFGHAAGDEALQAFSEILAQTTRRMNLSARFGGEEFLTVLAGSDAEGALVFAERVRSSLRGRKLNQGSLTVSAGVAAFRPGVRNPDELLASADHALYQAKREGKNRVRLFGKATLQEAVERRAPGDPPLEEGAALGYPRAPEEIGRTRPPVTLLPQQRAELGAGRRILVVEGEEPLREVLVSFLVEVGFEVAAVQNPDQAVGQMGVEYDVVVAEVGAPGRLALEFLAAVRARWPATQLVVTTEGDDAHHTAEAMSAGADRYLLKPFGTPELEHELVEALARRDRVLVERARRRVVSGEAREREDRSRLSVLAGARALVEAVEIKDPFIRGHHARVARYTEAILKALDPEGVRLHRPSVLLGAQLLDLGKIDVPDAVLNKPASLSPEEVALIQKHPETGRRILEPLLTDEGVLEVVAWHHERWDGGGYPNRLAGDAIPLGARIVAVADALDALTSPRAFRGPFSFERSVGILREEDGGRFDPQVMAAFERALPTLTKLFREAHLPPPVRSTADPSGATDDPMRTRGERP